MDIKPDRRVLIELAHYKMPFGKFEGRYLVDLPESYLIWFKQKGFPKGKLGEHLQATLDIKSNGLEPILRKLREEFPNY